MNPIVRYQNGNYTVTIDTRNGTKIRENDLDFFEAAFPESMDIKITNRCNMNCPMCHEDSKCDGAHGDKGRCHEQEPARGILRVHLSPVQHRGEVEMHHINLQGITSHPGQKLLKPVRATPRQHSFHGES